MTSPRVVLLTGANGGIGGAIVRAFLSEPDAPVLWLGWHRRRERLDALAHAAPGRLELVQLEVTSREHWDRAVAAILDRHGRLDVLINNAGGPRDSLLGTMPVADWEEVRATHLDAVFHGCQAVLPAMIAQRWGRIVNMASVSALLAPAGQANYAAAKAGVVALTRSLAKEVARIGITVNAVCPGYIETEALGALDPEARRSILQRIPARRLGRPEEVAAVVRFLACPDASYLTGSAVTVDGGIH
ncbi:MAG: SDR family oxidoreductase [Verrucomicrobiae bacterium]|nr:SDR family oxidoreductase [Verrucomicrobiae bacterium]